MNITYPGEPAGLAVQPAPRLAGEEAWWGSKVDRGSGG